MTRLNKILLIICSVVVVRFCLIGVELVHAQQKTVVIAAVGDIACDPASPHFNNGHGDKGLCQMEATAKLTSKIANLQAVLPLGDNQYEKATLADFQASYDPSWGRFNKIAYPVAGNHEYQTKNAQGYYQYYGSRAHDPTKGYYSYDLGNWHLIALNSNCQEVGGCGPNSPQEKWLLDDLATHKNLCTIAYWHHPLFSSGTHGNYLELSTFWQDLYQAKVELVLVGHDHLYERFARQNPDEKLDPQAGIREIVIGTGGKNHYGFGNIKPNSQVRNADTYGVLKLNLAKNSYSWEFLASEDGKFTDKGTETCF